MHIIPYIFKNSSKFQHVCVLKLVNFNRLFFRITSCFHTSQHARIEFPQSQITKLYND
jgi:hypothetical protein